MTTGKRLATTRICGSCPDMVKPDIRAPFISPSLDPQKLSHFLAVYTTGSFSAAASENGVSQQAVSKSIARLEELLGVALFERSPLGARPTRFADSLARRAQTIVAEGRLAAAELAAMRGSGRGYVRIGLSWSFLARVAPDLIRRFKAQHPEVTLSIVTGQSRELYQRLLSGDVEWAASAPLEGLHVPSSIERQPLFVERDMLIMRADHPMAASRELDLPTLAKQTWCLSMQLEEQWQRICDTFLSRGLEPPRDLIDLDSILLVKSLLLASDGIGLLPETLFEPTLERPRYAMIADTPFTVERTAYTAVRKGSELQPLARRMLEQFERSWREHVPVDSQRF